MICHLTYFSPIIWRTVRQRDASPFPHPHCLSPGVALSIIHSYVDSLVLYKLEVRSRWWILWATLSVLRKAVAVISMWMLLSSRRLVFWKTTLDYRMELGPGDELKSMETYMKFKFQIKSNFSLRSLGIKWFLKRRRQSPGSSHLRLTPHVIPPEWMRVNWKWSLSFQVITSILPFLCARCFYSWVVGQSAAKVRKLDKELKSDCFDGVSEKF